MSTFEDIMSALSTRHPATLRRILANLPTGDEQDNGLDSAQDYAQHLRRALGQQAFDLLTSQLNEPAPLGEGVEALADEVSDVLTSTVRLEGMANKTADAVAAAYRQQQSFWSKAQQFVEDAINHSSITTSIGLLDAIRFHASSIILAYTFLMALYISSSHTISTVHPDSVRSTRARKKVGVGVALFIVSAFSVFAVERIENGNGFDGTYVFPAMCLGTLMGRWRLLIPSSRLWPR